MKPIHLFYLFTVLLSGMNPSHGALSSKINLNAKQALLIDLTTNEVIYEQDADKLVPPSSMSKIMTVYLAFDALSRGQIAFDDTVTISKKAWQSGGSRMFVEVNSQVKVIDLLRGVIVQSGNDAAIALAEGIAGSEAAFVELMNQKAREIGAVKAQFFNATGWPHPEHLMTLHDLAIIAKQTMIDFPQYYGLYAEKEFTYNKIRQENRNPLLTDFVGCDGLKTGHTEIGGHGLVASAVQDGRRLLMVINGCTTKKTRAQDAKRLLNWGFRHWVGSVLFSPGQVIEMADVWLGTHPKVGLYAKDLIAVTVPRHQVQDVKAEVVYNTPIAAPIKKDTQVGKIIVTLPDNRQKEYALYTRQNVEKAGFFKRIRVAFSYLVFGG